MAGHPHDERRHLAVITFGVTAAFGLAALGGQVLFRDQFGPAAGAVAAPDATDKGQVWTNGETPTAELTGRLTDAAGSASDRAVAAVSGAASGLKRDLEIQTEVKKEQVKAEAKAVAAREAASQWQALQEKVTDLTAPAATAPEGATPADGGDEAGGGETAPEQGGPAAELSAEQKAAVEEAGREAWGLWRSLWEALKKIFHDIAGALRWRD